MYTSTPFGTRNAAAQFQHMIIHDGRQNHWMNTRFNQFANVTMMALPQV